MTLIYEPAQDSFLLEKTLLENLPELVKVKPSLKFLEIGIGLGIQLEAAKKAGINKENIFGVDLNMDAIKHCQKQGFYCIKSDLFTNVKEKYDVIIFNPPYLPEDENPEDKESKLITTGGKFGSEIPNEFLKQAKNHLKEGGVIFILISSLTKRMNWLNYKKKLIAQEKLFFEKLEVWELRL